MENKEKLISVIIPVYNRGQVIKKCVKSITEQSYKKIEILIINDGSTDDTLKICQELQNKDIRIRIITTPNQGVSGARNTGIEEAKGEYIQFVDSDDYLEKDILEEAMKEIENNDMLIYGYQTIMDEKISSCFKLINNTLKDEKIHMYILENINKGVVLASVWNKLYKKKIIDKIRFEKNMSNGEDFLFNILCYEKCNSIKTIDNIGYNYCIEKNQRKFRENQVNNHIKLMEKLNNYFEERIEKQKYIDTISDFFYITIFYDLLAITGKKGISIKKKMEEYNKIKQSNLYKKIKYNNKLSNKKNIILNMYRKNNIITYFTIKLYLKFEK